MTNISRTPLGEQEQTKLFNELSHVIGKLSEPNIRLFLTELLGPEEKIMIIKRFAAIVLLEKGYSISQTAKTLKLSTSTLNKLNRDRHKGKFINISQWLEGNHHQAKRFIKLLDSIFTLGDTLPYYGKQSQFLKKVKK